MIELSRNKQYTECPKERSPKGELFVIHDNTPKRKVQVAENIKIGEGDIVNLTRLGKRHAEVVYMTNEPYPGIRKLNSEEYVVIKSGEVRRFKKNDGKTVEHLKKVFKNLEHLIKTNFDTEENEHNALFITLTYAENMKDAEKLYKDFNKFMKRLKHEYSDHEFQYIAVAEPQGRGAWHMHVLLKSDKPVLYIDNKKLSRIWRHGFTETERIKGKDPGKYFAAYFTSLEVEAKESEHGAVYVTDSKGKKHKKGARLNFYPKGMQFYRCSRNIIRPVKELEVYGNVTHEYGKPVKANTYAVIQESSAEYDADSKNEPLNTIQREEFRKRQTINPPD